MAGTGFEYQAFSSGKPGDPPQGGAESGAVNAEDALIDANLALIDANLALIIDAWPTLPDDVKAGILSAVQRATTGDA